MINNIIYEDETGYIKGYLKPDGYWWIKEFVINPKFRNKKLAKTLASHLPQKCKLLAYPLMNSEGPKLSPENLIKFYQSIGFYITKDKYDNQIMQRD